MANDVFKALSDPTRRQILELLSSEGDLNAGDISSRFDMSAPSISHHLSTLKSAGLVLDTRKRQSIVYSLNTTVFQDVVTWLYDTFQKGETNAP